MLEIIEATFSVIAVTCLFIVIIIEIVSALLF